MSLAKKKRHSHPKHSSSSHIENASTITFSTQEFVHHEKDHLWYIGIGLLLGGFLFLSLKYADYLSALVVVAVAIAVFRLANLRPKSHEVTISNRGVAWGNQFFGFHQLKAFWVAESNGASTVYLERPNFAPTVHFAVPESKLAAVGAFLATELPYHDHRGEPLNDRLARLLKL